MVINFFVNVSPKPWKRIKLNSKTGNICIEPDIREYVAQIKKKAKVAMRGKEPFNMPVNVQILFSNKLEVTNKRYGGIDNLAKVVLDAMTGIIYTDVLLISHLEVIKSCNNI